MAPARGIDEGPDDLARVVDPVSLGENRPGSINRGEGRAVFEKPVSRRRGIEETSPRFWPASLIPKAVMVPVAPGTLIVVKVAPSLRKPWFPVVSENERTIWPASLIPKGEVKVAPGHLNRGEGGTVLEKSRGK